jgi:Cytochrome c7 and related cytochrome c/Class III cytochrome C family
MAKLCAPLCVETNFLVLLLLLLGSALQAQQPIEFPHNQHIAKGLECIDCHITVDTRAQAGMPSVAKCMFCHEKVATDGPGVQKLKEYAEQKREIPWIRVYQFNRSGHVLFRHAPHVRAGVECATCHGNVAEMTVVTRQVEHNMGTCLTCHRQQKASQDCAACHF